MERVEKILQKIRPFPGPLLWYNEVALGTS